MKRGPKPSAEKAARVLEAIAQYRQAHGYSPTYRELQDACGYKSPSTITHYLERLFLLGWLSFEFVGDIMQPRSLMLTDLGREVLANKQPPA